MLWSQAAGPAANPCRQVLCVLHFSCNALHPMGVCRSYVQTAMHAATCGSTTAVWERTELLQTATAATLCTVRQQTNKCCMLQLHRRGQRLLGATDMDTVHREEAVVQDQSALRCGLSGTALLLNVVCLRAARMSALLDMVPGCLLDKGALAPSS